jgi:hypothetical protein
MPYGRQSSDAPFTPHSIPIPHPVPFPRGPTAAKEAVKVAFVSVLYFFTVLYTKKKKKNKVPPNTAC